MITFACACGKSLKVRTELAGKKAKCPGCGAVVPVPQLVPATVAPGTPSTDAEPVDPYATIDNPNASRSVGVDETLTNRLAAADHADFLSPPKSSDEIGRLGSYRVLKVLGKGGMGMVLEAEDPQLKRRVAMKVMLPRFANDADAKHRFLREAQAAAALEHDHIITIYQVGEDRVPFLAMPLLKGESLADCLKREGKLPIAEAVRIAAEIADGLAAAHDAALIHRDIKPANVWLDGARRRVKILDFGLARPVGADESHLTASGVVIGTPAYMAPEQARGARVDNRVDLFSLGCVLYQMAGGELPFKGNDTFAILTALAVDTPADPREHNPEIPPELSALILQLLAKNPDDRPTTASEVLARLRALRASISSAQDTAIKRASPAPATKVGTATPGATTRTITHVPEPAPKKPQPAAPKRRAIGVLVAVGVLLLVCGSIATFFGGQIIRIATNKGELVIVVDDPTVELKVVQNGVIVFDKTSKREFTLSAGNGEIEVLEKDGIKLATKQFELTRGGKTTIKVTLDELAEARKPKDPDRRAAEWVLLIGGIVRVNDQDRDLKTISDLPRQAFQLTFVKLNKNTEVTDAGLAFFKDFKNLSHLDLADSKVSDVGLAHFKDHKNLYYLHLGGTQVTNAGLAHFENCLNLLNLNLRGVQVDDSGLAHFKDCKKLTLLNLQNTKLTDAGLAHFGDCTKLTSVDLGGTAIGNKGLVHFKDAKKLSVVLLHNTKVSDAGLAYFKDCQDLVEFNLRDTQVSDMGTAFFEDCKNLRTLDLQKTIVTESGVKKLAAALPGCRIESDFGVFGPTLSPDRRAAEWVLSIRGNVGINSNGKDQMIMAGGQLPAGAFELVTVSLKGNSKVSDEGMAQFKDCKHLAYLHLHDTKLTDAGMVHFKDCRNLQELLVFNTDVTDAGIVHFKDCKNLVSLALPKGVGDVGLAHFRDCKGLTTLALGKTQVTDVGLGLFKDCKDLAHLRVEMTKVGDAGLAHFKNHKGLRFVDLRETSVSDEGLSHLAGLPRLAELKLKNTKVSESAVKKLAAKLPGCKIESDFGVFGPKGAADPDRRAAEYVLSIGGSVDIVKMGKQLLFKSGDTLPTEPFQLTEVRLGGITKVTNQGLVQFNGCKKLKVISLYGCTDVGDAGLANFKGCTNLSSLNLSGTQAGDAGLANFADCMLLQILIIGRSKVSDAGLGLFKNHRNLEYVSITGTEIGDTGIAHLTGCQVLETLNATKTKVTESGVKKLSAKLPKCKIESDFGVFGPTAAADPDRRAAEWALSISKEISINDGGKERVIKAVGDLPHTAFEFTGLHLAGNNKVKDAGLAVFKDCKNLTRLELNSTMVSKVGLANFKDCKDLTHLSLGGPNIDAEGLAHFKDCKKLESLTMGGAKVTEAGLAHFKDNKGLISLNLNNSTANDLGLAHFKDCKHLKSVHLQGTMVGDAGLVQLADCPNLKTVVISKTNVTEPGVKKLAAKLPGCKIVSDFGVFGPTGK